MRITQIDIPKEQIANGLEAVQMAPLDKIVILAGSNGAGKTRLLDLIEQKLRQKPSRGEVVMAKSDITNFERQIENGTQRIRGLEFSISQEKNESIKQGHLNQIAQIKSETQRQEGEIGIRQTKLLLDNYIITNESADSYISYKFVPTSLGLNDPLTLPPSNASANAQNVKNIGVDHLPAGALSYIQTLQDRWWNASHQNSKASEDEKIKAQTEYETLKDLIKIFLHSELDRNLNNAALLFNFPLGQTNLSPGQRILIQFCVALHSQGLSLENLILIMDEPENHLHPSVILETVDRIIKNVKNGQVWISTHSIPLLAHFDPKYIWFVDQGKVSHAGKDPEKVLTGLLGNSEEIAKLRQFIALPSELGMAQFMYACLFNPVAVQTGKEDPQTIQIWQNISSSIKKGEAKILDYGAGKGRLLASAKDNLSHPDIQNVNFVCLDLFENDKKDCEEVIISIYGNSRKRYYNTFKDLSADHPNGSFKYVIMCNVLHEIDPLQWLELFSSDGDITQLLSEDGMLLIAEDNLMPVGEQAYDKGFLVLDTAHLRELFKIKGDLYHSDARNDGRLKCHMIPKTDLINISAKSRMDALKAVRRTSEQEIVAIRKTGKQDYKTGLKLGFWLQQLGSSVLSINQLGEHE